MSKRISETTWGATGKVQMATYMAKSVKKINKYIYKQCKMLEAAVSLMCDLQSN